jgi:hypothetical protein
MKRGMVIGLALLGGCSADPCAGQAGACLSVMVEGGDTAARVDGLRMETRAGVLSASTLLSPTGGAEVDLPVTVAVVFDSLAESTQVGVAVTGLFQGASIGRGEGGILLAPGEHRSLRITLQSIVSSPDMSVDAGKGHDGSADDLGPPDLSQADLVSTWPLELTVFNLGGGSGTVTSNPPGLSCAGGTCVASFAAGTTVELSAAAGASYTVGGWGADCPPRSGAKCTLMMSAPRRTHVSFGPPANYVFVSSTTLATASFGAGGNAITVANNRCATLASAAGLPGTFKGWISTTTANARDQLGTSAGWLRPDGLPFANSTTDLLTQRRVFFPPLLDENGVPKPAAAVATGTGFDGTYDGANCIDWSNNLDFYSSGRPSSSLEWSNRGGSTCGSAHIYCFGTGRIANVVPAPMSGRKAFVSGAFSPSGGVGVADAKCQGDAANAGLPGSYKALLATSTSTALSRVSLDGPIWVRPDGVPLVLHASDLAANVLFAGLDRLADGSVVPATSIGWPAWTGADSLSVTGVLAQTCADWTTNTSGTGGITGSVGDTVASPGWLRTGGSFGLVSCGFAGTFRLYCVQE